MKNKLGHPLVIVSWLDSRQPTTSWCYLSNIDDPEVVRCLSVGWLTGETDECVMLCATLGDVDHDEPQGNGMTQIPRACITSITVLETTGESL